MLSELDDLKTAAQVAAKVVFAGGPGSVAAEAAAELEAVRNMIDAAEANALSAVDAAKEYAAEGHKTVGVWLQHRCRLPKEVAQRRVRLARRTRGMPETADAWCAGDINEAHVQVLARANRPQVAGVFAEAEAQLVDAARTLEFRDFCQVVRYWEACVDPDDLDKRATRAEMIRSVHHSPTLDGMGRLDGTLTPVARTVFGDELDRLEHRLFEEDWKEARTRLGEGATAEDLLRTPAQRRHDALVEMAKRSRAFRGDAPKPTWVLNLHMDWATYCAEMARYDGTHPADAPYPAEMISELDDGTVLPPSQLLSLALQGQVRRVVFGPDGHILDFGRAKRLFDGALRDALKIRDRTCAHPGCEVPAKWCEADHVTDWAHGGPTSERNGQMRCDHHNRWKHRTRWRC